MSDRARALWRDKRARIAAAAVVVTAAVAALTPAPQAVASTGAGEREAFAALASAAIVTLSMLPFVMWRASTHRGAWMTMAVAALVLGLGTFALGGSFQRACTARYTGTPVVIGTDLTPTGAAYQQAHPELSSDDLLFDAAGVAERVWTRSSIGRCTTLIVTTYFLWIPFLVVCLVTTAQAIPTTMLAPIRWEAPAPTARADQPIRYDVFVSYRHDGADGEFAKHLVTVLEAERYRVAIDERDFAANASFLQEMERCIRESRFTVAVISARYLGSGNCEEEAAICKVLDMGDRRRRLIPLVVEPVSMPAWLYGIVGIDCTKRDPLVDPFDRLKATLGTPLSGASEASAGAP